jgi:hypothetical protein
MDGALALTRGRFLLGPDALLTGVAISGPKGSVSHIRGASLGRAPTGLPGPPGFPDFRA